MQSLPQFVAFLRSSLVVTIKSAAVCPSAVLCTITRIWIYSRPQKSATIMTTTDAVKRPKDALNQRTAAWQVISLKKSESDSFSCRKKFLFQMPCITFLKHAQPTVTMKNSGADPKYAALQKGSYAMKALVAAVSWNAHIL